MAEKLTLARYLQGRGEVKALTHIEALAFGVPYPLQPGWPSKYGAVEITVAMIEDLRARILTAKESTASKARRGLDGIEGVELSQASAPAQPSKPALSPPTKAAVPHAYVKSAMFHGFVLRQARRYRSRTPAPWT